MDIQTSLIYGAIVIVCAVVLFAISMFGIKEKTYEEAIAEQRQMPSENLLLGRSKDKNKDKKQKKAAGKKVKEKPAEKKKETALETATAHHENHHVEFEPEAEVIDDHPHQDDKKKKKKMKPILVNKAEHNVVVANAPVLANHFEESMPKDDLMLRRQSSREDIMVKVTQGVKVNTKSEKVIAPKPEKAAAKSEKSNVVAKTENAPSKSEKNAQPKSEKVAEKSGAIKTAKAEIPARVEKVSAPKAEKTVAKEKKVEKAAVPVVEEVVVAAVVEQEKVAPFVPSAGVKEQKNRKKKSDLVALQQMTEGVNVSLIVPLVQKAELSRTEIQNLIDLLLNKQQGSAVTNSEWIEGRQDPMVKLRKQLAEKEKALTDEQEAALAVQNKLKELRVEFNAERSRWRHVEETAAAKQIELVNANTRFQHEQEARKTDSANLNQQLQGLQAKMAEDHALIRKLQEEQSQQKGALQQDFMNTRNQLELHIAHITEQSKETVVGLESEVNLLRNQLAEAEQLIARLKHDFNSSQERAMALDADRKMFQDKINLLSGDFLNQEGHAQGLERQLEEMHHVKANLEHRIATSTRNESQLSYEKEQLLLELEATKGSLAAVGDAKGDLGRVQAEKDSLTVVVGELKATAKHAKEENDRLTGQLSGAESSCRQLREEIESLAAQLTAVTERPAAEGRENGDAHPEETAKDDASLLKQKEVELATEINKYKTEISNLNSDLEAQRQKNNELRTKNWKAMEALSATEKSLETQLRESKKLVNESSALARLEEQKSARGVLERLFPDVSVTSREAHATWLADFETAASKLLAKLRSPPPPATIDDSARVAALENEVAQLHSRVATYKQIIQDTESLLNQLQTKTEETEAMWRQKHIEQGRELEAAREEHERLQTALELASATQEASSDSEVSGVEFALGCIEKSLPPIVSEMQSKLRELEEKLHSEEIEKHELTVRLEELHSQLESNGDGCQSDLAANIRQLSEERVRLQSELTGAEDKCREMAREMVKLRSLVQIGQDSLTQEHQRTETLQHQVDKFNGVNDNHSVSTNGAETETSLSESLSVSSELLTDTEKKPNKSRGKKKKPPKQAPVKRRRFTGWFRKKVTSKKKMNSTI